MELLLLARSHCFNVFRRLVKLEFACTRKQRAFVLLCRMLGHLSDLLEFNLGMRLLLCVPLLNSLTDSGKRKLINRLRITHFAAGDNIISPGMPLEHFVLVKDGIVLVEKLNKDGLVETIELSAGQWYGTDELQHNKPVQLTATAKTAAECFLINRYVSRIWNG